MSTASRTTPHYYDGRAIMADAIAQARAMRSGMALSWREALALALRTPWVMAHRRAENLLAAARTAAKPARIPARDWSCLGLVESGLAGAPFELGGADEVQR